MSADAAPLRVPTLADVEVAWRSFDAIVGPDAPYYDGPGRSRRDRILALLDDSLGERTGRALDLGCGVGYWSRELARRGWDVLAVDRSPRAIRTASDTYVESPVGSCEYLCGDWREVLGSQRYDAILMVGEMTSYVPDVQELVDDCLASVSSGGRIVGTAISLTEALARSVEQGFELGGRIPWTDGEMVYWEHAPAEHPAAPIAAIGRTTRRIGGLLPGGRARFRAIGREVRLPEAARAGRAPAAATPVPEDIVSIFGYWSEVS